MTFAEIQTEFAELHLDTSSTWITGGSLNKKCVNKAYEYMYDILKNSAKVKKYIGLTKTNVVITNKVWTLPATFDTIDFASMVDFSTDSWVDWDFTNRYFDFEIRWVAWAKTIVTQTNIPNLYITFLPLITVLSADWDKPSLIPSELHRCIADFALVEYFRRIRDDVSAWNALQLAQSMLNQKLITLW